MNLQERSQVLGFKIAWSTFGYLPESLLTKFAAIAANRTFNKEGAGVNRLSFNLARVTGLDVDSEANQMLTKQTLTSYMHYWMQMFALTKKSKTHIFQSVVMHNQQIFEDAVNSKNGVVLAVTHSGNWDLAGAYVALKYGGITTVAERLRPVELFDEFCKHRRARNIKILPHRGGAVPPSVVLATELKQGKLVGLVTDRDMSHHGVQVDFFGHAAKMPVGAAKLAIENSAVLIPAGVFFEGSKTCIEFYPAVDLSSGNIEIVTQEIARVFETIIAKHPENWHMLQKIWLDMPKSIEDNR